MDRGALGYSPQGDTQLDTTKETQHTHICIVLLHHCKVEKPTISYTVQSWGCVQSDNLCFLKEIYFGYARSSLLCQLLSSCSLSASYCDGFSCCGAQTLGPMGSVISAPRLQNTGSTIVAHGPSCSIARRIFPDQGPNACLLNWQEDSLPLSHQGSPTYIKRTPHLKAPQSQRLQENSYIQEGCGETLPSKESQISLRALR